MLQSGFRAIDSDSIHSDSSPADTNVDVAPAISAANTSTRGAHALLALHLPPSLSPDALSPRLWAWANGSDARSALSSSQVIKASGVSSIFPLNLNMGMGIASQLERAVLKRAAQETKLFAADATLYPIPQHLTNLAIGPETPSIASFSSRMSANVSKPNFKQRKPVDSPPPLPPRKDQKDFKSREVVYVAPSVPRLFVQLVDLRLKNSTQAFNVHCTIQVGTQVYYTGSLPLAQESKKGFGLVICPREGFVFDIPSTDPPSPYPILIQIHRGPPPPNTVLAHLQTVPQKPITFTAPKKPNHHRRKRSNDSVSPSISSISSTLSKMKMGFKRLGGSTRNAMPPSTDSNQPPSRRMTLNIASPFRKPPAMTAAAVAVEPNYAVPCYHGPTTSSNISRSESQMNLFSYHGSRGGDDGDGEPVPESLLGQVVVVPGVLQGDRKACFEKTVQAVGEPEGMMLLAAAMKGDSGRDIAVIAVQVGMLLDEKWPLEVEIPPIEYSTFLNFQKKSRGGGGTWRKYWVEIKKGVLTVYDFEYKESKPIVSSLPLQTSLERISRPDPEEMAAPHCLQLDFNFGDDNGESLGEQELQWRHSVVEENGIVYVTAESKEALAELEKVLVEFL